MPFWARDVSDGRVGRCVRAAQRELWGRQQRRSTRSRLRRRRQQRVVRPRRLTSCLIPRTCRARRSCPGSLTDDPYFLEGAQAIACFSHAAQQLSQHGREVAGAGQLFADPRGWVGLARHVPARIAGAGRAAVVAIAARLLARRRGAGSSRIRHAAYPGERQPMYHRVWAVRGVRCDRDLSGRLLRDGAGLDPVDRRVPRDGHRGRVCVDAAVGHERPGGALGISSR